MTIHPLFKFLMVAAAYLLGSVPFGLVLSRLVAGVDVRGVGSGNIGATNVTRAAGKLTGILTLVLDAAKSAVPVLIAILLLQPEASASMVWWVTAVALAAFFGHLFSVWLQFKGGKGVATGLGVFLVLAPWVALAALATFILVYAVTRIASLGSLAGTLVCAGGVFVLNGPASPISWGAVVIALAITLRHKSNISRLLQRAENKV